MARRPTFLNAQIHDGEFAQFDKEESTWYICRHTSVRLSGKSHPEKTAVRIAISTPLGRKELTDCKATIAEVCGFSIYEFGFSYSMKRLCPNAWKKHIGSDWEMIFLDLIRDESPGSYLLKDVTIQLPEDRNIKLHKQRLLYLLTPEVKSLVDKLKTLHMVCYPDKNMIATPDQVHSEVLAKLNLSLSGSVFI